MSFPHMNEAFWGLTDPVVFTVVQPKPVDYEAVEVPENQIYFDAVIQPLNPRLLIIKPEGERKWKWWTMWTEQILAPDSVVQDESGAQYRIMPQSNWDGATYREYEILQGPFPIFAGQ